MSSDETSKRDERGENPERDESEWDVGDLDTDPQEQGQWVRAEKRKEESPEEEHEDNRKWDWGHQDQHVKRAAHPEKKSLAILKKSFFLLKEEH